MDPIKSILGLSDLDNLYRPGMFSSHGTPLCLSVSTPTQFDSAVRARSRHPEVEFTFFDRIKCFEGFIVIVLR